MKLTIVGLGPAASGLMSVETMNTLREASKVILRTKIHPTVAELDNEGIEYETCDLFYENSQNFDEVYGQITEYVLNQTKTGNVVYAVPGSPLVAEKTVVMLREALPKVGLDIQILPSMSFLDLLYAKLALDPINGLRIIDAGDVKALQEAGRYPLVVTQVYSKLVASELKMNLMDILPDEASVFFLRNLGLPDEIYREIPLYELDWQAEIDHLTTIYIPPVSSAMDLKPLIDIVKVLREPNGCPWDIVQTHESIRKGLIEECYEVLEAIDNQDVNGLEEELGDVLLQVVFHARIAEEKGLFTMQDVINHIVDKLIERHPHVFGAISLADPEAVIEKWEDLKAAEKKDRTKVLDGVSPGLPTLMRAYKLQVKAAKVGFDWPSTDGVLAKIAEEIAEVQEAVQEKDKKHLEWELGDLLFALVNYVRHLGLEPETALNKANNRFIKRFNFIEEEIKASGATWQDFSLEELENYWQKAKKVTNS